MQSLFELYFTIFYLYSSEKITITFQLCDLFFLLLLPDKILIFFSPEIIAATESAKSL